METNKEYLARLLPQLKKEIWKPVDLFSGCYEVSNIGNIRSVDRHVTFSHYLNTNTLIKGKIRKQFLDHRGYYSVTLRKEGNAKTKRIHRLVALAFIPNPNNYIQVNHMNGIKTDNRVENLEWCTNEHNHKHAVTTGLVKRGENSATATITEDQARNVKILLQKGVRNIDIHRQLNISLSIVEQIKYNNSWTHIII